MAEKLIKIETETETEVDTKNFQDVNKKAYDAVFDNSHKTNAYTKVVDEIETQTLTGFKEEGFEEVVADQKTVEERNPFFGDKDALKKMQSKKASFKDVVSSPADPTPTLEIKEEIAPAGKKQFAIKPESKRKKFWQITGIILIVLFLGLFGYNMISINTLAKKVAKMEHQINEQEQVVDNPETPQQQIQNELQNGS